MMEFVRHKGAMSTCVHICLLFCYCIYSFLKVMCLFFPPSSTSLIVCIVCMNSEVGHCLMLQHIGKSVASLTDNDAISFWRTCFRWRVLGPSPLHRIASSDMLER